MANANAKVGIDEMGLLFTYLGAYRVLDKLSFDLSLARGLDYYTGIIYEAIVEASAPPGFKDANAFAEQPVPEQPSASSKPKPKKTKPTAAAADADEPEIDEMAMGDSSWRVECGARPHADTRQQA